MSTLIKFALVTAVATGITGHASAKTLTIGIDISGSSPVAHHKNGAKVAGDAAGSQIRNLQPGDRVRVRTIGDRSAANLAFEEIRITRQIPAHAVANIVTTFIKELPSTPHQGRGQTNLVSFLEFGKFDCDNGGRVLLLTDGVESSEWIDADSFLRGKPLPLADKNVLAGCEVTMLGLGQSVDGSITPKQAKAMRASWAAWMKDAGAKFEAVMEP